MKNEDALKSLPRRSATARAAWSEETAPLCSSRTANELQHATRWRPSVVGRCKRGLSQLDHSDSESNWNKRPLGQSLALGWFYSPRAIKPSLGSRLSHGTFISVRSLFRWSNYYLETHYLVSLICTVIDSIAYHDFFHHKNILNA